MKKVTLSSGELVDDLGTKSYGVYWSSGPCIAVFVTPEMAHWFVNRLNTFSGGEELVIVELEIDDA